jgi:aspartyl aminopeptidase
MNADSHKEALDLVAFVDASPSPYHAAEEAARRLEASGFVRRRLHEEWSLAPGERFYVIHGGGSLFAAMVGSEPPAESGFVLLGAHTDSPNLRLKPSCGVTRSGHHQLVPEVYGGVLLGTWLDRELAVAGRVSLRGGSTELVRVDRPLCHIPSLAIHLDREVNTRGLIVNPQNHLLPTIALATASSSTFSLYDLLAESLAERGREVKASDILAHDLCLYDFCRATLAGANGELVCASRLDNLAMCHAALAALSLAKPGPSTRGIMLYDHEEVGSQSASGARSEFLLGILERLSEASSARKGRALGKGVFVSCDMAHAANPNYLDKHDPEHLPLLGRGPVLKTNANQSYSTSAPGSAFFREACETAGVTHQVFAPRNDGGCGSTIGPITGARTAIRTLDIGNPMLGMHACREMAASLDVAPMIRVLVALLEARTLPDPDV